VEAWTCQGPRRFFVLFFIELSTRRVQPTCGHLYKCKWALVESDRSQSDRLSAERLTTMTRLNTQLSFRIVREYVYQELPTPPFSDDEKQTV
jgi:hypothetical protein